MKRRYKAHPFMAARLVKPFLFVLVLPFLKGLIQYLFTKEISGVLTLEFIFLAAIILIGWLRLRAFGLFLQKDAIIIEQGFIFRKRAEIPINRISSVVTLTNPIDALFSAVTFRVNTEAGVVGKPDFEFKLYKKDAIIVSERLYGKQNRENVRFSVRRLILAAALSSSAVTGMVVAVPIILRIGKLLGIALSDILIDELNKTAQRFDTYFPPIFNLFVITLLVSYVISFIYTLIGSLRFRLYSDEKCIEIRRGVFIQKRILFKKARVNDICIDQTPLMRLTRLFCMRVAVGGFGGEKAEKALIVPIGQRFEIKNRFSLGLDFLNTKGRILRAARGKRMLRRFMCIPMLFAVGIFLLGAALMYKIPYFDRLIAFMMLVLLFFVGYYAFLRYHNYRFGQLGLGENVLARGSNGINTRELYVPKKNIGIIKITQNFIDIREKTCKVTVTVRSESADHVKVRNLDYDAVFDNIRECYKTV